MATTTGTASNDILVGGSGADILYGGAGSDFLNGGSGADILDGGSGIDNLLGGSGADLLIFNAYENQYMLGGTYSSGILTGATIYDNGVATGASAFSGYDNYDGGNGSVKGGTAENDTLKIVVSVQQSNDAAFMQALNSEINYFKNVWLPAHTNKNTGQASQDSYEFKSINLKISAIEIIADIVVNLSTNRAPINTVPSDIVLASEDVARPVLGVSVSDPDGGNLTTTISVLHGSLSVIAGGGAIVSNNGTSSLTVFGTAFQINAVLASLTYTGSEDYSGTDSITVNTTDGLALDVDTINVTVNAVADAPNLTVAAASGNEDTAIPLSISSALTDTDGSESLSINISGVPTGASLSAGTNNGGGSWTLNPAQLAGLTITPALNSDADFSLTVTATATEANGGDTETTVDTINVTVNAVNDGPTAVGDNVITNVASGTNFIVPEWALLLNDLDPDGGGSLDVSSVSGPVGLTATHAAGIGTNGTVTINDPTPAGTSFNYIATDGITVGSAATVTVAQDTIGTLDGTAGNNILVSSTGGAILVGGAGNDVLLGGSGNDTYRFGLTDNSDVISDSGSGNDTIEITTNTPVNSTSISNLNFQRTGNDLIIDVGATQIIIRNQYVSNGNVEKIIFTQGGTVFGYNLFSTAYNLNTDLSGGGNEDVIASSLSGEALSGGNGHDLLFGNDGDDNPISGGGGNDLIVGGAGADSLFGGNGNDTLVGGTGLDSFIFNSNSDNDSIWDFEANAIDAIHLDDANFSGITNTSGSLTTGDFTSLSSGGDTTSVGALVNIIFDQATGVLYYDSDGGSNLNRTVFATLNLANLSGTVNATDFLVI